MGARLVFACLAAALAATPAFALLEPQGLGASLHAAANERAAFVLSADGVMIYQCKATLANPDVYAWFYVAPDATLYDGSHEIARMTTPNLLESLDDGSSVSGIVRAAQSSAGALPWTLSQAQPIGETGLFANVSSMQRVNTRGGLAPSTGCNPDNDGAESRVAFNADYYFYRRGA
ncbi:MAG TPA: DUF3455 domain-containing protein [Usitatibacter sp.]|jgi:hypothetical protein|nr:DUF3455 domain-containing protein [Usitatibacter sp.]